MKILLTLTLLTLTLGTLIIDVIGSLHRVKRQNAHPLTRDCALADVVFLLDSSSSIKLHNWNKILEFVADVVSSFVVGPYNVQVGVAWYSNIANVEFEMNQYDNKQDVLDALATIPWKDQGTNTSGALRLMYRDMFSAHNGDRYNAANFGIVITNGFSNRDETMTIPEADKARQENIQLFAIGIGDEVNPPELRGIANKPSQNFVFNATDFDALQSIRQAVVTAACDPVADK